MKKILNSFFFFTVLYGFSSTLIAQEVNLPPLFESDPYQQSEKLGKVSASAANLSEARDALKREASKLKADAVFNVICQSQGIYRNGLTWEKKQASCDGVAVRWKVNSK